MDCRSARTARAPFRIDTFSIACCVRCLTVPTPRIFPVHTTLAAVADALQPGDLLLFRGTGLLARVIGAYGRSQYSHAAMVGRCSGRWMCLEMRELRGGRAVTLESQVRRFPGRIDVYTVAPEFEHRYHRAAAADAMLAKCGRQYSYYGIYLAALRHLPFVRVLCRPAADDRNVDDGAPEFCSQAIASAARIAGGVDPVPNAADRITEPADLSRSRLWEHRWTLAAVHSTNGPAHDGPPAAPAGKPGMAGRSPFFRLLEVFAAALLVFLCGCCAARPARAWCSQPPPRQQIAVPITQAPDNRLADLKTELQQMRLDQASIAAQLAESKSVSGRRADEIARLSTQLRDCDQSRQELNDSNARLLNELARMREEIATKKPTIPVAVAKTTLEILIGQIGPIALGALAGFSPAGAAGAWWLLRSVLRRKPAAGGPGCWRLPPRRDDAPGRADDGGPPPSADSQPTDDVRVARVNKTETRFVRVPETDQESEAYREAMRREAALEPKLAPYVERIEATKSQLLHGSKAAQSLAADSRFGIGWQENQQR